MFDLDKILSHLTPLAVAIGAALGYLVKLRWSREYEKAMEDRVAGAEAARETMHETWQERLIAVQDAMRAQLEAAHERALGAEEHSEQLLTFSPDKIKREFSAMQSYYEDQISGLKAQLMVAESSLAKKEDELKSRQAASERFLHERLSTEKKIYEEAVLFLKAQIEDLQARERVLEQSVELLQKKPFEEDFVKKRLKSFSADITMAKIKYENAQRGVHASVAAYMNAQATAKVEREEKKSFANRSEIPLDNGEDT